MSAILNRHETKTKTDASERGWFDVLQRLYTRFSEDRVKSIAGGVTFFALLAIFPAIAALVSIYGLFADPASLAGQTDQLSGVLPSGAIEVVGDQMRRVSSQGGTALGATFLISLAISLWSANSGMKAMFDAQYRLRRERKPRILPPQRGLACLHLSRHRLRSHCAGGRCRVADPHQLCRSAIHASPSVALRPLADSPCRHRPRTRDDLSLRPRPAAHQMALDYLGSATAALLWLTASALFSWYAANFAHSTRPTGRSAPRSAS